MGNTLFRFVNRINHLFYRVKGALLYRHVFGHFGNKSVVRRPLLISNPQFIYIGDRVFIRDGARLEAVRDGSGRIPVLKIGSGTSIEQRVHIVSHSRVEIGDEVCISGNCCILDTTHPALDIAEHRNVVSRIKDEDSFVVIGDSSFIGFGSVILPNVRIGKKCQIGALSVVTEDVPDFSIAVGAPARVIKHYDLQSQTWIQAPDRS